MTIEWSGKTSSYHHKWNDTPNPEGVKPALTKRWFLDAQWSDCPIEVEDCVKDLWRLHERGNDHYIIKADIEYLLELKEEGAEINVYEPEVCKERYDRPVKVDALIQYLREQGIGEDEEVILHWWW